MTCSNHSLVQVLNKNIYIYLMCKCKDILKKEVKNGVRNGLGMV